MEKPTASPPDEQSLDRHAFVLERLSNDNHRYTTGRHRLVDALAGSSKPLTLPDIVAIAPDLAASSVYRNLEVLEQCGVVKRITSGSGHAHFELAEPLLSHHHHLVCVDCGEIEDVRLDDEVEELLDQHLNMVATDASFKPLRHNLDLQGHCEKCQDLL
ncbi:MAG: transcriptional repressor [Acidimicrobiaceae bacterium]|nr:Fur family transcriptional regulator [Acidimicrobiaceae bacterium]MXW62369.1 transcriptional repressor [Acidimicrobiaceae bacterium]MXW74987.1 transcriptional repressor [Acidimicrobiaceae bacterium]MYA73654.1 transcriptional repressor [Acidimicrobiaceae bacterium]MYC41185.1 transcriptional repressor [Acidimicrobiaceae bacterium]